MALVRGTDAMEYWVGISRSLRFDVGRSDYLDGLSEPALRALTILRWLGFEH